MTAAIILIALGVLITSMGIVNLINWAIQCWRLLCQICFKKNLEKISYDIPLLTRWIVAIQLVAGVVIIIVGFKILP